MTKTYLVSYASGRFIPEQACLMESAIRFGVTDLRPWTEQMLRTTPFYGGHSAILNGRRGAGYWLWKPFVIVQTLSQMLDGDYLIYCDSGIEIVGDLAPILKVARERDGVTLFSGCGRCGTWTKRDCFVYLNADEPAYHQAQMLDASCLVLIKNHRACAFADNWLQCCLDRRVLTDDPNSCGLPNLPGFIDHRHDQSVLSILAKREHLELFRAPTQYGSDAQDAYPNSPYGTLLNHHRGWPPAHIRHARDACERFLRSPVEKS